MNVGRTPRALVVASLTFLSPCTKERPSPMSTISESTVALHIEQKGGFAPKAAGNEIGLLFVFKNTSAESILINGRGIVAGRESAPFIRDIWLSIKNQKSGRTAEFGCLINAMSLGAKDLRTLAPGETFQFERDLHCFRMEAGRSLVSAHVDVPLPAALQGGKKTMSLPVASNEIEVEIR